MSTQERIKLFEERFMAWFKTVRDFREIKHGDAPNPADFGLDDWTGKQIKMRVQKELERTA